MAFKIQEPGSTKRTALPGQPTQAMLDSDWTVLDVLGNPWGSEGHDEDEVAKADADYERKIKAARGTKAERDHQIPTQFVAKGE